MTISFTKTSNTQNNLEIEVSWEAFEGYLDRAARKLSENLDVQGFRKGHVPRNIVEQKVGSDALYKEAAQLSMEASYIEALGEKVCSKDSELDGKILKDIVERLPKMAVSEVSITKLAPNNPFMFKIVFNFPYFSLVKDYRNIAKKVADKEKREVGVEENEVEETLNWLRRNHAKKATAEESSVGKSGENNLPELDDDFAKSVGNFKNLEALKKSVAEGIKLEKDKKEKDRIRIAIIKKIAEGSKIEIPKEVISGETQKVEEEFKDNISHMGLELNEYLDKIQKKKEDLEQGWREKSAERVEIALVLDAVAEAESIEPNEEDVKEEAQKLLKGFKSVGEAEKNISPERLREYVYGVLRNEKTLQFLEGLNKQ